MTVNALLANLRHAQLVDQLVGCKHKQKYH